MSDLPSTSHVQKFSDAKYENKNSVSESDGESVSDFEMEPPSIDLNILTHPCFELHQSTKTYKLSKLNLF